MTQNLLQATRKRYSAMLKLGVPRMANDSLLSEQELVQSKVENGRLTEEEARPVLEVYKQIAKELQQKFQQGPCGQRLWRPHEDHSMKEPVMAKQWNVRQKRISRAEYDAEMNAIAQELIRTGKMPALEEFVKGIKEAREKYQEPVNLDYLTRAVIVPTLKSIRITWHGWHAFRRGLATNLTSLGSRIR